ncbi:hypothetical protein CC99x_009185 [Candidatus Berkiella cookevillensis]|uniref:Peptidase M50 domain-containing protein n=1 Tax=Candidatus Berkiella cookevillensis TaxID=437022 RepID=A0A0Q9YHP9_9GAMM|nr:site-2 protease family protein [Candidatus Berkiella cookevillensis]MCS5709076.1 hypothetical protein [Candidatus Berkiella cookevillensis]
MNDLIFSPLWYKVSDLKLRLKEDISIQKQSSMGNIAYLLHDKISNKHFRFQGNAYYFIGLLNGTRSVDHIWKHLNEKLEDDAPTQIEIVQLIIQLASNDLIKIDGLCRFLESYRQGQEHQQKNLINKLMNPLSIKLHIANPDNFLNKTYPYVKWIFTPLSGLFCILIILLGLSQILVHFSNLYRDIHTEIINLQNLSILIPCYCIIKLLHELGHAYAVKRWGGIIQDMGVVLMALIPFAYVNASAATLFKEKYKRIIVSAAGIIVELFLASISILIWVNISDGFIKLICLNIISIGLVSTFFFNGNPLLKYDGYYILADLLNISNLSSKSKQYLMQKIETIVYGKSKISLNICTAYEKTCLILYGILSSIYRIFIFYSILVFIINKYFFWGVIIAIWTLCTQIFSPIARYAYALYFSNELEDCRNRIFMFWFGFLLALYIIAFHVKIPCFTYAEGIVWIRDSAIIRAQEEGFVSKILKHPLALVNKNDAIIQLDNFLLSAEKNNLIGKREEIKAMLIKNVHSNYTKSENLKNQYHQITVALDKVKKDMNQLSISSQESGRLILMNQQDLIGKYIKKGDIIGYIQDNQFPTIQVAIPQSDFDIINDSINAVKIKFNKYSQNEFSAQIINPRINITNTLPSASLGNEGGGTIKTNADKSGIKTEENIFVVELSFPTLEQHSLLGKRVYVKLYHNDKTLAHQLLIKIKKLFFREINA